MQTRVHELISIRITVLEYRMFCLLLIRGLTPGRVWSQPASVVERRDQAPSHKALCRMDDTNYDEDLDTFNDETFGGEFDDPSAQNQLPAFFGGGEEPFGGSLEGAREDDFYDRGTFDRADGHYQPTASHRQTSDEFYYIDTENEINAAFDSQMRDMFNLVLNDDDEESEFGRGPTDYRSQNYNQQGWDERNQREMWYAEQRQNNQGYNQSPHMNHEMHYAMQQQQQQQQQQHVAQSPPTGNTLAKFFGNMAPQGMPQLPPMSAGLSLEELEARQRRQSQPPNNENQPSQEENEAEATLNSEQFPALSRQAPPPSQATNKPITSSGSGKTSWAPVNRAPSTSSPVVAPRVIFNQSNNRQLYSANNVSGSPRGGGYGRGGSSLGQFRPRWKESRAMMSAEEIDTIIRMQESQLHSSGTNPYAEDYYHQSLMAKQKTSDQPQALHKPLFESNGKTVVKRAGVDPLEGVLGRIPSHSVRAPRPLLQIKLDTPTSGSNNHMEEDASDKVNDSGNKAIQGLLLTIEAAYNILLDIEDIDSLLQNAQSSSSNYVNPAQLKHKRDELTCELFEAFQIFTPQFGQLPQRTAHPEEQPFIYPEDAILLNVSLVQKGKKLVVRSLPLLFSSHLLHIYNVYIRNLALFSSSPRLVFDLDLSNQLFSHIHNITALASVHQTIFTMQSLLVSHTDPQLIQTLQSKFGITTVQNLLKRAHDLNLSFFSREPLSKTSHLPVPELAQLAPAGFHWRDTVAMFSKRIRNNLHYIYNSDIGTDGKMWEFFAILVVNVSSEDKASLMRELRDRIMSTPSNPTLGAFIQLANESNIPLQPMNPAAMGMQQQQHVQQHVQQQMQQQQQHQQQQAHPAPAQA
ncbi:hypothetical protein PROFUN_05619 [Planoprotostelium fungivorum]|uniref:mRNA decay factor PAT1 domain-containing protein n=1 Tax=Planoprotostelium fungivorum TaxID=1890364 RepID=A0A2P6MUB6_9EUKA|nr:hypothetical protein PROFUN_05619 [Planoprotostelium fungivorum]